MEEKEKIHAEIEARLAKMGETIESLKEKSASHKGIPRASADVSIEEIHIKKMEAEKKFKKLSQLNADDRSWEQLKKELDDYIGDIDSGLRKALAYFH